MEPKITRSRGDDGCDVIRIEIANRRGLFVTMDAQDYDQWLSSGRRPHFILNRNGGSGGTHRVVFYDDTVAGGLAGLARQLANPGRGRIVEYRDGDRLNLRRANLGIRTGKARGQSAAYSEFETPATPQRRDAGAAYAAV